ncbi:MAG: transcriptional repressor [Anaerolineaceae bacterium]|nr:transcriptional repressor [Anaerolineaceae bacterium]
MATNTEKMIPYCMSRLSAAGYKATAARKIVLQALCELPGHCTSADVLNKVNQMGSDIGRASVFRILELFSKLSIIRPTYVNGSTPEYVLLPKNGHHAHIVCPKCNKVTELKICPFEPQLEQIAAQHEVQLTGHILELFGYCAACSPAG